MNGRNLGKVLRCSSCGSRAAAPRLVCQRRAFTSSNVHRKNGAVPKFSEVSSPELQEVLANVRMKVFVPAHLERNHRALIYRTQHQQALQDDPVNVEIAGETFELAHIDMTKDVPGMKDAIIKALSLMKDRDDWVNLPTLLEGFKTAQRRLSRELQGKMVRKAGRAGRPDIMLECARMVSRTGFVLKDPDVVQQLLWWMQYKPLTSDWDEVSTAKALSMAEQVTFLLEDERHLGGSLQGSKDARVRPDVVGVLLELAAMRAKARDGKDEDGKVEMYAQRLLGILARRTDWKQDVKRNEGWWTSNYLLSSLSPVLKGMQEAIQILGPGSESAKRLGEQVPGLSALLSTEREVMRNEEPKGTLGVWCYDKMFGSSVA